MVCGNMCRQRLLVSEFENRSPPEFRKLYSTLPDEYSVRAVWWDRFGRPDGFSDWLDPRIGYVQSKVGATSGSRGLSGKLTWEKDPVIMAIWSYMKFLSHLEKKVENLY